MTVAKDGSTVALHYKGTLADGAVFDHSEGREPLSFVVGEGQVIPGFENAVRGMKMGEKKTFTVKKGEGYEYHAELVQTISRDAAPKELALTEGMSLALRAPNGQVVPARITKLTEKDITLDLNSPLAGKELTFAIEIVKVE